MVYFMQVLNLLLNNIFVYLAYFHYMKVGSNMYVNILNQDFSRMYQTIFRPREFRIQWLKSEPQVGMINSESIGFHPVDLWIIANDMLMQI